MVLNRLRPLTEKTFQKMMNHIFLNSTEKNFLNQLRIVDQSENAETRIEALQQILKISKAKDSNSNEYKVFEYLTKWHTVAIYEMFALPSFQFDPAWIQKRLIKNIALNEIEQSLEFLKSHHFIQQNENGQWMQAKTDLQCKEGIFKLSLGEFHRQMLSLASFSIDAVQREDRFVMGQSMALSKSDFLKIKEIINHSIAEMNSVNKNTTEKCDIYHIEIAAFPLSLNILNKEKNEK